MLLAACLGTAAGTPALAVDLVGDSVKDSANGVLALMGFIAVPDVTASSLSYDSATSDSQALLFTQLAGGFTLSKEMPLYLEGGVGYSRYDPEFVASSGDEERPIPVKWNSLAGTVGVGWSFPLGDKWVLRPIGNFTLGYVESDVSLVGRLVEDLVGSDIEFLEDGRLKAYGLGGSLMLDFEDYLPAREHDLELRLTHISLHSYDTDSEAVEGHADAITASLWARRRVPSGYELLGRPLRYVFEGALSSFHGDQRGALGFNYLTQLGVGLEIDTSAVMDIVSRGRLVGRYVFGDGVSGVSIGMAVSF